MYSYNDIYNHIKKMGIKTTDTLLVHSSMKSVGEVKGGADTVIDALIKSVEDGMLVIPTHTWATVNSEHSLYDSQNEPACIGIIPNLFMKREGVVRSLHPTHSVAAFSKNIEKLQEFVTGEENQTTPCSRSGCYGKLYDLDAKILLLGVGLNRNTYMHGVEEWFGIKERLTKETMELSIALPDGRVKSVKMHKHYKPNNISISEYYVKMEEPFEKRGALKKGRIGDAKSMCMSAVKVADITTEYLKEERDIFTY